MDAEHYSICETCGKPYLNFCVGCAKRHREELVEALMDKYHMDVEALIQRLGDEIIKDNFAALKLAITLRDLFPPKRADLTSDGGPLFAEFDSAKDRLADKIARVLKQGSE